MKDGGDSYISSSESFDSRKRVSTSGILPYEIIGKKSVRKKSEGIKKPNTRLKALKATPPGLLAQPCIRDG